MTRLLTFLIALCFTTAAFALPGSNIPENVGLAGSASFPGYASYSLTVTATQILDRRLSRNLLIINNSGATNNALIKPGSAPSSSNDGIVLVPGASLVLSPPFVDLFYARAVSSTTTLTVIQGSK